MAIPPITINGLNPVNGRCASGYPVMPTDRGWMVAPAYLEDIALPMRPIYPLPAAGTYAAHKWADTKAEYSVRLSWQGGLPPFQIIKAACPSWAQLGVGVDVQNFDLVASEFPGYYEHKLPTNYALITGTPTLADVGQTFYFSFYVRDQKFGLVQFAWYCTVDDSGRIKYLDSVGGLDTNAGTFAAPFQTFPKMWNLANADQFIFRLKNGTYTVSDGASGNALWAAGRPKTIEGIGNAVILSTTTATFAGGGSDITLKNLKITGAPAGAANPKQLQLSSQVIRLNLHKVEFDSRVGTTGNDNPCGVFLPDTSPVSRDISVVDCKLSSTATSSMVIYFAFDGAIEENCTCTGVVFPLTNGSLVTNVKGKVKNYTSRFCSYSADSNNGLVWVSNQNYEACENSELLFNLYTNIGLLNNYCIRFNSQVNAVGMFKPAGQTIQRCTISAGDISPVTFENYQPGIPVSYGGLLWSSTTASAIDSSGGGTTLANTSTKVSNVNTMAETDIGNGWRIISPMVT